MAIDPQDLPAQEAPVTPEGAIAEVAPEAVAAEPSAQLAVEAPKTYTADEWFSSPEYQSRKDKEIAAWEKKRADEIAQQSAEAERSRASQARADLVQRAYNGDLDAQAQLATDEYTRYQAEQSTNGFRTQWLAEAEATTKRFAAGDPALEARFNVRNFNTVVDWNAAMVDYKAEQAVKAAEARLASDRAVSRNAAPNPDTSEMVGGYGGPVASLSLTELNARYAKAKDDGNSEEVARLKGVIRQKDTAFATASRR